MNVSIMKLASRRHVVRWHPPLPSHLKPTPGLQRQKVHDQHRRVRNNQEELTNMLVPTQEGSVAAGLGTSHHVECVSPQKQQTARDY